MKSAYTFIFTFLTSALTSEVPDELFGGYYIGLCPAGRGSPGYKEPQVSFAFVSAGHTNEANYQYGCTKVLDKSKPGEPGALSVSVRSSCTFELYGAPTPLRDDDVGCEGVSRMFVRVVGPEIQKDGVVGYTNLTCAEIPVFEGPGANAGFGPYVSESIEDLKRMIKRDDPAGVPIGGVVITGWKLYCDPLPEPTLPGPTGIVRPPAPSS